MFETIQFNTLSLPTPGRDLDTVRKDKIMAADTARKDKIMADTVRKDKIMTNSYKIPRTGGI